ncbi:hypothetical protein Tco_1426496 [Tanacetum coccineum]
MLLSGVVIVEAVDREESETGARGPVEVRVERVTHHVMPKDTPEPTQEERVVECTYETLGILVQRFHDHTEAIPVHRVQVIEGVQREQGRRIIGVESVVTTLTERIAVMERDNQRLRGTMHNTRSGASMANGEIEDLIARRREGMEEMEMEEIEEMEIEGMEEMEMKGMEEMKMEGMEEMKIEAMEKMEMEIEIRIMA